MGSQNGKIRRPVYMQYGCGLCGPSEWLNFDASPVLRCSKAADISAACFAECAGFFQLR